MARRLHTGLAYSVFVTILCACSQVCGQSASKVTTFSLENYGWETLPKTQRGEWPGTRSRSLSIDHSGRVLVGFTTRRDNDVLATREHPASSFHIVRFTAKGKMDQSFVLAANNLFTNGFYLGPDDQIFARANEAVQWKPNEDAAWRPLVPCPRNCYIDQSPSRRTLIVSTNSILPDEPNYDRGVRTHAMIDASSSPPRIVQDCPDSGALFTDKFVYQPSDNITADVRRWPLCDKEHVVELSLGMRGGTGLLPLTDQAILLLGTGKPKSGVRGVDLVTPDGKLIFHREFPKHDYLPGEPASTDEHGDRFAFVIETWRGGSKFLDISGTKVGRRVVVYTDAGQEIASITVSTVHYRDFAFALSPDGRELAIIENGVVTVANLP